MSFDREDPADLAALKSEVNTDPISMGYDPSGPTQAILKLLNDPANNVGGETAARPFDAEAMLDALEPNDFEAPQTTTHADTYTQTLVGYEIASGGGGGDGSTIEAYKAKWRGLFASNSATVTALDAQNSALSRAEVLFGQGTVISRDDWLAARDS